jgi:hypothetical protein
LGAGWCSLHELLKQPISVTLRRASE